MQDIKQNEPPIHGATRSRKMENAQEVFSCQCGKKYLTFSALYLHVRIKHDIRLSTKKSQQNHQVEEHGHRRIITYFLKQPANYILNHTQNAPPQHTNKPQYLKDILQRYRSTLTPSSPQQQTHEDEFLRLLEGYIDQIAEKLQGDKALPDDLVFYFNEFSFFYLPMRQLGGIQAVKWYGAEMLGLWKWLKLQGLTSVELQLHELYRNVPKIKHL